MNRLLDWLGYKIKTMVTKKLIRKQVFKEDIIGAFKKSQPQAISFLKGQLIKQ